MTHGKLEQLFVLVSQISRHCRIDVVTLRWVETDKRRVLADDRRRNSEARQHVMPLLIRTLMV